MLWVNILGYAASASVLATFCMTTMVPLRLVAIFSNVLFAAFGALAHIYPVLVLHVILLPINVTRLLHAIAELNEQHAAVFAWAPWMAAMLARALKRKQGSYETKGCFAEWHRRVRSRHDLVALGECDLRDMRVTRCHLQSSPSKTLGWLLTHGKMLCCTAMKIKGAKWKPFIWS
jgi:uncharacterized protein YjiS (DUF1127 family)